MKPRFVLTLSLLGSLTIAADWPGRERELASQIEHATPARRIELLTQIAASPAHEAELSVVAALTDPESSVRMAAADLVARHRFGSARDMLIGWLSDPDPLVRAAGAHALGAIADARASGPLVRLLGDADVHVRLRAVEAVAAIGGADSTVPLLNRLADAESPVRVGAAQSLGDLGDPRAVLSLLGALQDSMPEVREATAIALGKLHDARASRGLLGLLRDPVPEVRLAAARALGTLGSREAVIDLAPLALRDDRTGDLAMRAQMARAAIDAIGRIGGAAAADVLVRAFRRSETEAELSRAAADALRSLGDAARAVVPALAADPIPPALLEPLEQLLGDIGGDRAADALIGIFLASDGTRSPEFLLRALGRTGTREALRVLLLAASPTGSDRQGSQLPTAIARHAELRRRGAIAGLLAYSDVRGGLDLEALDPLVAIIQGGSDGITVDAVHEFIANVARLIGATRNPRAPRVLAPLLSSERQDIRIAAAAALARVGVAGVEQVVADALSDESSPVRLGASDALGRFGNATALNALISVWNSRRVVDRASAARAIGQIAARIHDSRATQLLSGSLTTAAPGLAAAILDALAPIARTGDHNAVAAIVGALTRAQLAIVAIEALGNSLDGAPDPVRNEIIPRLQSLAATGSDPTVAASAIWSLGRAGASAQPALLTALASPASASTSNAAGALARIFERGARPDSTARDTLCAILSSRRHPSIRANVLLALARGHLVCDVDQQRRVLLDGRLGFVRFAAAESLFALSQQHDVAAPVRAALEQCAHGDRSQEIAAHCQALLGSASSAAPTASQTPRDEVGIDVLVIGEDEDQVATLSPIAIIMSDGVSRLGLTGPTGWLHERPAPPGSFTVVDPEELPLEP